VPQTRAIRAVHAWPTNYGQEWAFFAIFSTMIGAIEIARLLPDPAIREKALGSARDFLLRGF
jgi:TetR/AcrR family transcriptional repressor of nem operon